MHPEQFQGLFLFGAYITNDLSNWNGSAIVFEGSDDKIVSPEKIQTYRNNLPSKILADIELPGFNHASFGGYRLFPWDWEELVDGKSECGNNCIETLVEYFYNATLIK